jgi:hypothetical protein
LQLPYNFAKNDKITGVKLLQRDKEYKIHHLPLLVADQQIFSTMKFIMMERGSFMMIMISYDRSSKIITIIKDLRSIRLCFKNEIAGCETEVQ